MKLYTPIEVIWRDSVSSDEWIDEENLDEWERDDHIRTLGYFVRRNKVNLLLAMSTPKPGHEGQIGNLWSIPIGCIISVKRIHANIKEARRTRRTSTPTGNKKVRMRRQVRARTRVHERGGLRTVLASETSPEK